MHKLPITQLGTKFQLRADFTDGKGNRHQIKRRFDTEEEATTAYYKFMLNSNNEKFFSDDIFTFNQAVEWHLLAQRDEGLEASTLMINRNIFSWYLCGEMGEMSLSKITLDMARKALRRLVEADYSTNTIRLAYTRMNTLMNRAVREGRIIANPVAHLSPPKGKPKKEHDVYTIEQLRQLLPHIEQHRLHALWILALNTGMRRGEIVGLRWSYIDLENNTLQVQRQRTTLPNGKVVDKAGAKSESSLREVMLTELVIKHLKIWKAEQEAGREVLGNLWRGEDYVFTTADGSPYNPASIYNSLGKLTKKAGLPSIPLHYLRHTYATVALEAGADVGVVSKMLGHANSGITRDLYMHVSKKLKQEAAEQTSKKMFG